VISVVQLVSVMKNFSEHSRKEDDEMKNCLTHTHEIRGFAMENVTVNKQESLIAELIGRRLANRQVHSRLIWRIRMREV
jgi:hypothetical protein